MNERVSIIEGNITRRLIPVDKLKINNSDNSDSLWVPKNDRTTGTLYATENGVYIASEDGYYAYDEVVIRVTGDQEWNDVYPDGSWDADTYQDYLDNPSAFDDTFNDPDKFDDPSNSIDYHSDAVTGIDPDTGNITSVWTDADGCLIEKPLPSKIVIEKVPDNIKYHDGEEIDFTGMIVKAYLEDGTLWTDSSHPDGVIPLEELTFPVKKANAALANAIKYAQSDLDLGDVPQPVPFSDHISVDIDMISSDSYYNGEWVDEYYDLVSPEANAVGTAFISGHGVYGILASKETYDPRGYTQDTYRNGEFKRGDEHYIFYWDVDAQGKIIAKDMPYYTHNGKKAYYNDFIAGYTFLDYEIIEAWGLKLLPNLFYEGSGGSVDYKKVAWTILYGKVIAGVQLIPVEWTRMDEEVLKDSFFINVAYPGETIPDGDWNNISDPYRDSHDIPETPEGEVNPE